MAKKYDVSTNSSTDTTKEKKKTVGYFALFRFASKFDLFLIGLGILCTILKSLATPLMLIVYGEFTTLLVDRTYRKGTSSKTVLLHYFGGGEVLTDATVEQNRNAIINDSIAYGIFMSLTAVLQLVAGIFSIDLFNYTAIKQITRIRIKFFQSLMRQEIGWYDVSSGNNVAVRLTEDIDKIRDGIGEKVSHFLWLISGFVICVGLSFYYGWELTLVVISYVPLVLVTNVIIGKVQAKLTSKEINAYAVAGNVVEEVVGGIRTVVAFCGEKSEVERYNKLLTPAQKAGARKGLASGIGEGIMRFLFFASNALAYWYGVKLVLDDRDKIDKSYTPAVLMITFFSLIVGADNVARTAPYLESFASARGSATTIFKVIDRKSKIDSMATGGKIMNFGVKGDIEFRNVKFSYPSRPDVKILHGLSTKIRAGETVAFVGYSGNGKSTCLQLLQRFYDPDEGRIYIDDCDIKSLNISLLRSKMAMVGQEPVLFSTTIGENIRYGNPNATEKEIVTAAQEANAHSFIANLPDGYNTLVGEKGCQLSGGQKQRVAIARALIQNPRILLLDEATSALDYESEKSVQAALDKVSKGRTTIVVSHRLSAIRNADRILFIDKGEIIEDGSHAALVALKGRYYEMVTASNLDTDISNITSPRINEKHELHEKLNGKQMFLEQQNYEEHFKVSTSDEKKIEETVVEKSLYWQTFKRILRIAKPEWLYLIIAVIAAFLSGSSFPVFAILFGEFYGTLSVSSAHEAMESTYELCMWFLITGSLMFFAILMQIYFFNIAGVHLTTRIRSMTFASMLKQEMGWFDDDKNSVGALSARLTGDAASVQGAIGYPLSGILQCIAAFLLGVVVAFNYSWKLSAVCLSVVPVVVFAALLEAKHMAKTTASEKRVLEEGTKIATEALSNIRTIASLRQEPYVIRRYVNEIFKVETEMKKKNVWRGLVNSTGQALPIFGYAVALYYGGLLVADGEMHFKDIIKVSEALLYGTLVLGQFLVFAPSFTSALVAAQRLFKIIDREPNVVSPLVANKTRKPDKGNNLHYKQIDFRYPTRLDTQILSDLNLHIFEGKTVALVGPSGSGKSTCVQLLQRLYDPELGRIYIGLDEISGDLALNDLRSKLSIVSQEPVLFDRTIAENIAYGYIEKDIAMADIIEAAKMANVHNFIASLPQGYDTSLGSNGAQLSGGQKQRVAIARALIRNPKILLLDEATSALDLQSEQIVQQALDMARTGRTCLIIAHRLTTVQNADLICVLQNGQVFEQGTHAELLASNGIYAKLYNSQPGIH